MPKFQTAVLSIMLLLASFIASAQTIEMKVNGLVCAFCAQGIEKTLRKQSQTEDVFVSLKDSLVAIALRKGSDIPDDTLRELLKEAGYTVVAIQRHETTLENLRAGVKP